MTLEADRVAWRRGGRLVVDGVSLRPGPGATVGLLGPNGSGKSSLLRLLQGTAAPDAGVVTLDGAPLRSLRRREVARAVATVTQQAETEADLPVRDVVRLGRTPHRSLLGGDTAEDLRAIERALEQVGLGAKADHLWHTLSGGERQRAHIARALAQEPRELLMDEPTNHLDIRHQLELLALVRALPVTTIVALHDLNLAALFCDEVLVLREGRVVAGGTPEEVLTPALIAEVYGVRARVVVDAGRPHVLFDS
ncbi:histidinol phosphatase [Rathayibacter tritici]|uniref:ABC transporter ATP-binding protein n=1 Tax=Rathayibacter tritici TaxID=33888 RepID=UPI000CE7DB45|nr:ABC transporter ATP-binding protein [Rathayibacter tritici]PPF28579.1 histidinol phosphatase [Rathayibacter tritici]PPF69857.1 histidinol phosphatase [Rathayibacter tritici]PPG09110.1 histidinol phosphatase [Rathayibacter tritici]PPI18017.1 histidinol phosphatase [Rathayibacter tritici]